MILTAEDCKVWKANPHKNPKTHRVIALNGPTYKKITKDCELIDSCDIWIRDKTRHPITKRKLNINAKNGIFKQLELLCQSKSKTPVVEGNLSKARERLISKVKKVIDPILNKSDSLKARVAFSKIIDKYIDKIKPCIEKEFVLNYKSGETAIKFKKRIGSESIYGVAYLNMGKGFANLLKFSCKIVEKNPSTKIEIDLLDKMTKLAKDEKCPNMPITYKTLLCTKACKLPECPESTRRKSYYVIVNELANYDIQNWMREAYDIPTYESIIMQMLFSIYAFHNLGYNHNDCHLGNFLVHKIKPGGCWRYQIDGIDVYVPNKGYLLVLWDPGMATKNFKRYKDKDYIRPLNLFVNFDYISLYNDMGLKSMPASIIDKMIKPIMKIFNNPLLTDKEVFAQVLREMKTTSIVVNNTPPDYLLNVYPYTC